SRAPRRRWVLPRLLSALGSPGACERSETKADSARASAPASASAIPYSHSARRRLESRGDALGTGRVAAPARPVIAVTSTKAAIRTPRQGPKLGLTWYPSFFPVEKIAQLHAIGASAGRDPARPSARGPGALQRRVRLAPGRSSGNLAEGFLEELPRFLSGHLPSALPCGCLSHRESEERARRFVPAAQLDPPRKRLVRAHGVPGCVAHEPQVEPYTGI